MRNTTIGILAHVDAGKTTLSESLLQKAGVLRTCGRVDHGDAFLDTDPMEKRRGITIYSKLARFEAKGRPFTILDTPGHADFSPETERALRVLDAAVLVVSAADLAAQKGADPQVRLLWKLLRHYEIPTIIFVNKLDQFELLEAGDGENGKDTGYAAGEGYGEQFEAFLGLLQKDFGTQLVPFDERQLCEVNAESVAVCEDGLMERFLEGEAVADADVAELLLSGKLVPVYGGSALKGDGVEALLEGLGRYVRTGKEGDAAQTKAGAAEASEGSFEEPFGALVYKVTRENGTRLTWMKITSGTLSIRDTVQETARSAAILPGGSAAAGRAAGNPAAGSQPGSASEGRLDGTQSGAGAGDLEAVWDEAEDAAESESGETAAAEKISELRLYSGDRYRQVTKVSAGEIVAAAGLSHTLAGDGLGTQKDQREELLTPILSCAVTAADKFGKPVDEFTLMKVLRELEEQEPMLQAGRDENGDLTVRIMGPIQIEILQNTLRDKYDLRASFGQGSIIYQETIASAVEGVGHFEPLRHYAEVHLLLGPGERGSGIVIENRCLPNMLEKNWQNLILSQLSSRQFKGVLTGSGLTDVRISLLAGKANIKHTSGGDFRKAAYAAVRQGLMTAQNILLEPVLGITLELPAGCVGRAMTDISQMHGFCQPAEFLEDTAVLTGTVPASELGDYAVTVAGYTGGRGHLDAVFKGYAPCHNAEEVIEEKAYDPDADRRNPSWSVFCSHGAGTVVTWEHVREYMHVDTGWRAPAGEEGNAADEGAGRNRQDGGDAAWNRSGRMSGTESGPAGAGAPRGRRSGKNEDEAGDFKERQRAFLAEEEELRRIFEKTYGPVTQALVHPDNARKRVYGLVLPSEEQALSPSENEVSAAGQNTSGSRDDKAARGDARGKGKHKGGPEQQQEFLLVDGYNIIFAWTELKDLASTDIKSARDRLLDILSDYAGYTGKNVIVVFDAYRVPGGKGEYYRYHNLDVVFTKEAETADLYIEKTAHRLYPKNKVSVATGDYVEQIIIFGAGAVRLSPRGLLEEILFAGRELKEHYVTE